MTPIDHYWKIVLPTIQKELGNSSAFVTLTKELGMFPVTLEVVHDTLKSKFLEEGEDRHILQDAIKYGVKHTRFIKYLSDIREWAVDTLNINVPEYLFAINSQTPITLKFNLEEEKALMGLLLTAQADYKENRSMGLNKHIADDVRTIFGMLEKHGYDYSYILDKEFPLKK